MGKALIIAEKPSVAAEVAAALGGFRKGDGQFERADAIVANARGHLVELFVKEAETTGKSLEDLPIIPPHFGLRPTEDAGPLLRRLVQLMQDPSVDEVVNACDAGREGELIFRLIYEYARCRKPMRRMWLQSMTEGAIREAWERSRAGSDYDGLADAARCRSEADWLVGINGTRGASRLNERRSGAWEQMSVGRVQTPTLALVVRRENAIKNFVPQDYWEVRGKFGVEAGSYVGRWFDPAGTTAGTQGKTEDGEGEADAADSAGQRIFDKAKADAIAAKCAGVTPSRVTQQSVRSEQAPPRLFDLTTLQREANKRFKLSAKRTLEIAQALYERHKVTTYPRTDSVALPEDYVPKARELMESFAGTPYASLAAKVVERNGVKQDKRIFDDSKISDHFAIIPTMTKPSGLSDEEGLVYDLIARRFIAAFYPNAVYENTKRITEVAGEHFRSAGRVLLEPGWRAVWGDRAVPDGATGLCAYREGEPVRNERIEAVGLKTKPPTRYTEAALLGAMASAGRTIDDDELRAAMSERGLGTPATRAAIIEGLLSAGAKTRPREPYMRREGQEQHLVPTSKGTGLIAFLEANGLADLASAQMTAEWETRLLEVEQGTVTRSQFMDGIAGSVNSMIDVMRGEASALPAPTQRVFDVPCPKCGGQLAGQRKLICGGGCGFEVWTSAAGHALSAPELRDLLANRKTKPIEGLRGKDGKRQFTASLVLKDDFTVGFEFAEKALDVPCPKCGGVLRHFGATASAGARYSCVNRDFTFWMTLAGRDFSDSEAAQLVQTGRLPPVHGFMSSKRTRFGAGVVLDRDSGRTELVFPARD